MNEQGFSSMSATPFDACSETHQNYHVKGGIGPFEAEKPVLLERFLTQD